MVVLTIGSATAAEVGRRPVIAVVGENDGTEITDFVVPYGVLAASDVAGVVVVAVHPGPFCLMPAALTVLPDATPARFVALQLEYAWGAAPGR